MLILFLDFKVKMNLNLFGKQIVKLAKYLCLECEMRGVEELVDQESEDELIELEEEGMTEEESREVADKEEEEEPERTFTAM